MRNIVLLISTLAILCSCKSPEARRPISSKTGSFIDQSVARNKKLYAREKASFEKIMKANPENEYMASQNGFWYYYNTKIENDTLIKPDFGDVVNFNYNLKTLNGQTIYSKEDIKTQNYVMDKQELFSGLREGLKLMKAGETVTFMFPSQKAYGYYGDENRIGMNVPLICEVTVNAITDSKQIN
ncbi:gliding motility-associated peptidyl-prolyl isomerase GldI [Mangrovimonas spongiae]|uniref:Peptidyl-prolyl cis-trans isomerase n=1 Tax=Mangrovimonas spongiae TaxID=2494697 RepID=A0A428JYM2_9FLAO|nr:gliding motility-associated peptidyl-prolyl isomerase GldI [Mangrovimonas spongiae]RSK39251.1 gliding motility-associated peptidyl-prolyl isomerase GldI [Mangrovimonas spongiae]